MNNRERFLADMQENISHPYEVDQPLYEDFVGQFENLVEAAYFQRFVNRLGPGAEVLDLACGDGRHTLHLAAHARRVVCLDQSPRSLQEARRKCAAAPNVTFLRGSFLAPPFSSSLSRGSFDGVWFSQAFEYVPPDRRDGLLAALHASLKPGGILYMSVETWAYPSRWESLKTLGRDMGLFLYWKFLRGEPLLWGEFLYRLPESEFPSRGWHYHVHTSPRTLRGLLERHRLAPIKIDLSNGYLYVLCGRYER